MERGLVHVGIVALIVGFGSGYLICAYPEGLNPAWPIWMAMLAPGAFIFGGMHMVAAGLGHPGVAPAAVRAVAVCLLAIANWAAFFSTHIQCMETVSFLGVVCFRPVSERRRVSVGAARDRQLYRHADSSSCHLARVAQSKERARMKQTTPALTRMHRLNLSTAGSALVSRLFVRQLARPPISTKW